MKITMAHGSGGRTSAELMESVFGKHFKNPILDKMEDAAVLELHGQAAFSTDSFVVTPLVFKGGDIGKLCVCGTVNDLLMMGAEPKDLTCGFIMEEGLDIDLLDQIVRSMAAQAREAGVLIAAGDTKVVEGSGGLYINTTGNPGMAKAGSGDVLAGIIGAFLAQGMAPEQAAAGGVYLHGLAGDRCAERLSQIGMTAPDLIEELPALFLELTATK